MLGGKPHYARFFVGYHDLNTQGARAALAAAKVLVREGFSAVVATTSAATSSSLSSSSFIGGASTVSHHHRKAAAAPPAAAVAPRELYASPAYSSGVSLLGLDPHTTFCNPQCNVMDGGEFPTEEYISQVG
jgi:hypothetical protein